MRCPTLAELPPPPSGKKGWPWTVESAQLPDATPGGKRWPRVSIVTPSFNQGQFIEETIRSVLLQGYPELEYIIMDGGSTDGTIDILRKYDRYIAVWTSGLDGGQADAINKGFARAHGQIFAWLNSDDVYENDVVGEAASLFEKWNNVDVISGRCRLWKGNDLGKIIEPSPLRTFEDFLAINSNWLRLRIIIQPEAFFRQSAFQKAGGLRKELHYSFDACLWMDMAKSGCVFTSVDRHWANLRRHNGQKTADVSKAHAELARVAWDHLVEGWATATNPIILANDIFSGVESLLLGQIGRTENVLQSTSYRIGRLITKRKFW